MSLPEISTDGTQVTLTGDQVKFIRTAMGESQEKFAKRFSVSQPVIHRIERKEAQACTGPEIILISILAKQYCIFVPDQTIRRPGDDGASATA